MIEVYHNLWVGNETDELITRGDPSWFVIHACKEPFHRDALGYAGRAAPQTHPEYLVAYREGRVILNLVDAADPAYIHPDVISAALFEIASHINKRKVLVHCNHGVSRAPTIALIYLAIETAIYDDCTYDEAVESFTALYPSYQPAAGMAGYARMIWEGGDVPQPAAPPAPPQPMHDVPRPRSGGVVFRL